ncbi:MAG: FMN-binding protein [Thiotrichales bacterium]|nr:MAG: FMN-binding protein [Thiotrichales bacterium]
MSSEGINQAALDPGLTVRMLRTLGLVATLSGLLVVLSYRVTLPIIEENKRLAIERALFKVIPGAATRQDFVVTDQGIQKASEELEGITLYAGYDQDGRLKGVALEAAAAGYQDVIRILYGYDPYCQCIRGIEVLKMTETPGIGDKIAKDPVFLENFVALEARVDVSGQGLEHEIVPVKRGTKTQPWQIDSISGATISSNAVARMLNDSAQQMAPIILKDIAILEAGA